MAADEDRRKLDREDFVFPFVGPPQVEKPWVRVTAQMHDHAMVLAQVPSRRFYWDARTFVDTTADAFAYYGLDDYVAAPDAYNFEIEGVGGKMLYGDNCMPTIDTREPLIKEPGDLLKLRTPDFHRDGRLPFALECIRLGRQRGASFGFFCAPFSMAVGMRTFPALMKDLRKRPEFVSDLLGFIVDEVIVPFVEVQKDYCGVSAAIGADAWACIPNVSPKLLQDWILPCNRRLAERGSVAGVRVAVPGSGYYVEERPDKFDVELLKASFDLQVASSAGGISIRYGFAHWGEEYAVPVREYTTKYRQNGVRVGLAAFLDANLLRVGPVPRIVGTVKSLIDSFARDHDLSIMLANLPADTPPAHVHAAVAAVHTYGRRPIADDLDEVELRLPVRETFEEWRTGKTRLST